MTQGQPPQPDRYPKDDPNVINWNGRQFPRCTATNRQGERCKKPALREQTVCGFHGGNNPSAREKAARKVALKEAEAKMEQERRRAVERFGLKRDVSPSQALLDELQWTAGNVEYFRLKMQELGDDRLVMGLTKVTDDPEKGQRKTLEAKPSVWYELWMRERAHLVKVAAAAARAGVEQRRIELAEQTGLLFASVVRRVLDSVLQVLLERGHDVREFWDDEVRVIVPREFRAIDAVTAGGDL